MMSDATISSLQIEIESSASNASEKIEKIVSALESMRNKIETTTPELSSLKVSFDKLGGIKSAQATLKNAGKAARESRPDYSDLSDRIKELAKGFSGLPPEAIKAANAAARASDSLGKLSSVKAAPTLEDAARGLESFGTALSSADVDGIAGAFASLPPEVRRSIDALSKAEKASQQAKNGLNDMSAAANDAMKKFDVLTVAAGNLIADGLKKVISTVADVGKAFLNIDQSTAEYRESMGKINTAFENAGFSGKAAKDSYKELFSILGDTGQATEAAQLLANLSTSTKDLGTWTNIAAGVVGTFGDALPVESLIEAANETANVGKVTGTLADALNWIGISEDEANSKLASLSSEAERNKYIMETLSGAYNEAAASFYEHNEAIVKARENQALLDSVTGKLGETMSQLKTNIGTPMLEALLPVVQNLAQEFQAWAESVDWGAFAGHIADFIATIKDNGPVILATITGIGTAFVAWNIVTMIQGVIGGIKGFMAANEGLKLSQIALNAVMNANPLGLIVTAVAAVTAGLVVLWNTNEDFRNAVIGIWEKVKGVFSAAADVITGAWENVVTFFSRSVPEWWESNIAPWFTLDKWKELGKNAISGLISGLSDIGGKVVDFGKGILSTVANVLGINSPSKEFESIGEYSVAGMEQGFSNIKNITLSFENELGVMRGSASAFAAETMTMIRSGLDLFLTAMATSSETAQLTTNDIASMFRSMSNSSVSAINAIITRLNAIPINITTVHTIITKSVSGGSKASAFAEGGFPEHGQMFIARESGPELVGSIGRKTAVANNSQIIEGIRSGVYEANAEQNALLAEQNALLRSILAKEGNVYLDGKSLKRSVDRAGRESGAVISSGGVLAY